ncbi:hypothetical protein GC102_22910 [Paenibacillus sp. LMG 31460]|uniref:Uncharacterized protein n=1 Tax=Paenibacillus germinis TaxID=2654979 RepID=A0ABX1Z8K2_9BACL|nr:hypothetical protein [Paenibacillus germinis]NOU88581.1 hypothetical protein [Paenibacillus germinis]
MKEFNSRRDGQYEKKQLLKVGELALIALLILAPISVNAFQSINNNLPKEKQELLDREEALRKKAPKTPKIQNPQPKPIDLNAQIVEIERSWKVGIMEDREVPAGSHDVSIKKSRINRGFFILWDKVLVKTK